MSISERFVAYYRENFFREREDELQAFLSAIERSIPKTLRIRPGKEREVKQRLSEYGWLLEDTHIENVFSIDRREDFDPLERRLGFSLDHLVGNFYIQELAAATSVHILSGGKTHDDKLVILDMAASPGGKTTQLSEQFPESFIIANEPTRERIPALLQNLDRMGSANIGVTLYPGQYFRHTPEMFDRILLDAPCSGEGTLFKGTDAVKHWHIKNIKTIARLQEKLIDAAIIALKVGGEMVYSTCSMNLLENEGVLEYLDEKYSDSFEIIYQKRFWPHIDHTGGFFVAKIRKLASLPEDESIKGGRPLSINNEVRRYKSHMTPFGLEEGYTLYEHTGKVLALRDHPELENLRKKYYFMRWGEKIGVMNNGKFEADPWVIRYINSAKISRYELQDENELDQYLRGSVLHAEKIVEPGYTILTYQGVDVALEEISPEGKISNRFLSDWRRK